MLLYENFCSVHFLEMRVCFRNRADLGENAPPLPIHLHPTAIRQREEPDANDA